MIPADSSAISSRPNSRAAIATTSSTAERSRRSSVAATALPPELRIRAAVASAAAPSQSEQTTAAPSCASASAPAPPIPPPAPTTSATLPSTRPMPPSCAFLASVSLVVHEDGQSRQVEAVHARGDATDDFGLLVLRYPRQNLRQDLARLRKRRFAVRVVRPPHHVVDADDVAQPNPDGILLKAEHDVAAEEVARQHAVLEAINRFAVAL